MSLKSELSRLRKALADLPPDAADGRISWSQLFYGPPDERAAYWARFRERGRLIALATPTGQAWVAAHRRLGLPDPTEVPDDVVEQLIAMVGRPTLTEETE